MRGFVKILVVLLPLTLIGGIVINFIAHARNVANTSKCQNNLKQIGGALHNYQDTFNRLPSGTVPNPGLSPDQRLSWMTEIWPAYMEGGSLAKFDTGKAWNAEENCPVVLRVREYKEDNRPVYEERLLGDFKAFMCPSNSSRSEPGLPAATHYVGIAGVGEDAAELPLTDRRAGIFGYDRVVSLTAIEDGVSSTLLVAEVGDSGPWTAGGRATVRELASGSSYLGEGGQFTSYHREGYRRESGPASKLIVTNALLGDSSVYPFSSLVSSRVFEAMATINGGEEVGDYYK